MRSQTPKKAFTPVLTEKEAVRISISKACGFIGISRKAYD
jgi:hypothetical protein